MEIRRINPENSEDEIHAPVMASSDEGVVISRMILTWSEPNNGTLRVRINKIKYSFGLSKKIIIKQEIPVAIDQPERILLYMAQSLAKVHGLCDQPVNERVPGAERLEVCLMTDVARNFYGLPKDYVEVEPGWVRVSERDGI